MRLSTVVRGTPCVVSSEPVLHVEERGTGPAVVLLHGAPTSPDHMLRLAERLSRSYRALVVHLPGYGRSAPAQAGAIAPLDASHALVEEALVARRVAVAHLVGFSGGAYRAFALALRGTIRARSVVSLAGSANFTDEEKKGLVAYVDMLRAGVDAAPLLVDLMLSPRGREAAASRADVASWAKAISAEDLARELEAFVAAPDLLPQLASSAWPKVPVLLRVGSADRASPPERSRRVHDAFARVPGGLDDVRLEEVDGAGHALLCEDFDATAASLEHHLQAATLRG
jgi:pimeloyl-ACP methyl ester carboxylesterase